MTTTTATTTAAALATAPTPTRMHLLDLPPELVIRILSYLPLPALAACKRTHPTLRVLITTSVLLQYHTATQLAGVVDNPTSQLSVHERLHRLRFLEDGWAQLDFDFERTVRVMHEPSGIYDLTGGVYLLGDRSRRALHYCVLPSKPGDETRWRKVDVERTIIDMGLDVYEHDLVAVVTTTPQEFSDPPAHALEIVLLQLSTGKPHPDARVPRIHVAFSRWPRPAIGIEIVGDTLALVTTHYLNPFHPDDDFYVFDWKTGVLRMHATAPNWSYAGLLFLTPTLLLLPNSSTNTLEYWDTHPSRPPARPIGALALPPLSPGYAISGISCRCEPNPPGAPGASGTHAPPGLGFLASAEEAVAIFNVRIEDRGGGAAGDVTFAVFVGRGTLAGLCRWEGKGEEQDGESGEEEQRQEREGGDEGGVAGGGEQREDEGEEGAEGGEPSTPAPAFETTPWDAWGPDATRWLNADVLSSRWITKTAGARAAVMVENVGAVVIMDFHPARLRRLQTTGRARQDGQEEGEGHTHEQGREDGEGELAEGREGREGEREEKRELHTWLETGERAIVHPAFAGRVVSRLPYAARMLARAETYEGLLMDEERLIGLVTDEFGSRIREIVIHHLGSGGEGEDGAGAGAEASASGRTEMEMDVDVEVDTDGEGEEWVTGDEDETD